MKVKQSAALIIALTTLAFASAACNRSSPTNTLKAFIEAVKKKDNDGIKKALSKESVKRFEDLSKVLGKSLDETISTVFSEASSSASMPETRNEKIEGDTATLEVKDDKTGEWKTLPFVKEDGAWKIALDKAK